MNGLLSCKFVAWYGWRLSSPAGVRSLRYAELFVCSLSDRWFGEGARQQHDPEKWKPVFRTDHAQSKCQSASAFNLITNGSNV
jgi:hypothetical protein